MRTSSFRCGVMNCMASRHARPSASCARKSVSCASHASRHCHAGLVAAGQGAVQCARKPVAWGTAIVPASESLPLRAAVIGVQHVRQHGMGALPPSLLRKRLGSCRPGSAVHERLHE